MEKHSANIIIPMAGEGSRFFDVGYTTPKPLIDVLGKPMFMWTVESLGIQANYTFLVQKKHILEFNIDKVILRYVPKANIVEVKEVTEGAACTVLLAEKYIDSRPLIIANCDQYIEWDNIIPENGDGAIALFKATDKKWSFASIKNGVIDRVAEKNPISNNATAGYYYWKNGLDFIESAKQMIAKNIRTNNEFYTCPVYNEAIGNGKTIIPFFINKMWGLGTPEDLDKFISSYK